METVKAQIAMAKANGNLLKDLLSKLVGVRELFLIVLILVMGIILTSLKPQFLSFANIRSLSIGIVPNAIIAIGMTILLASGVFDLSVAGVMALAGTICGMLMINGVPIWLSVVLTLFIGCLLGAINGFNISKLHINPLIATFGMMIISRSISLILTDGYSVTGLPKAFNVMGSTKFLGFPLMVWIMIALVIVADLLLRNTRYLRQVFFVGGNEKAALLSGIKVNQVRVFSFVLTALLASIAGIILASRLMAGTPTAGNMLELQVIAACVIGGASLSGGEGTIMGSLFGVIFLSLIGNALVLVSASIYWHGVVNGLILIVAVALDMWVRKRRESKY